MDQRMKMIAVGVVLVIAGIVIVPKLLDQKTGCVVSGAGVALIAKGLHENDEYSSLDATAGAVGTAACEKAYDNLSSGGTANIKVKTDSGNFNLNGTSNLLNFTTTTPADPCTAWLFSNLRTQCELHVIGPPPS